MKRVLTILTLCLMLTGSSWAQCTITNPIITNASLVAGVAHFSLTFTHVRNNGNKWVTIHMWRSQNYPGYNYNDVPTSATLSGVVPFGTVVISNTNVSASGTYNAAQAFVGSYQNDGTFAMINTSASNLVYNASTNQYTLNNLQMILPAGTVVIKFDSWSSQSAGNNNVHCYSLGGSIVVPTVLSVAGLNTFNVSKGNGTVNFTWTTYSESNNSHFVVQEQVGSEWINRGIVFSEYEDGNSSIPTHYTFQLDISKKIEASYLIWFIVFVFAMAFRRLIPARLTMLVCIVVAFACHSCKNSKSGSLDSLLQDKQYRLKQVDRDQQTSDYSPTRFISI